MTQTPDDLARLKRYERLRDALERSELPDVPYEELEYALLVWQAQVALDKEQRRRDKEANCG